MVATPGNALNLQNASGLVNFDGTSVVSTVTPTNHAIMVGTGSNTVTSVGPATTGQVLQANTSADPSFSTATYPSTTTANQVLYSSATNTVGGLTTANNGMLVTSNSGVPSILAGPGATGKVLQSNAAAAPSFSTATFPSTATSTGTILRADGTNWSATTATYPNTTTANQVLYSSATNTIGGLSTANNGVLVTSNSGVPSILAGSGTTGQVLQSNAAAAPSFSTATYPSTASGTGSILRADGTNWSATTATYPNTTTTQQVLYSSAANTVSGLAATNNSVVGWNNSGNLAALTTPQVTAITFDGTNNLGNYVGLTSFTPSITGSLTNPTVITYTVQKGFYTRIGNLIWFTINIQVSVLTGGTGSVQISGLPFASNNTSGYITWIPGQTDNGTNVLRALGLLNPNQTLFLIFNNDTNGGTALALPLAAYVQFEFTGMYSV